MTGLILPPSPPNSVRSSAENVYRTPEPTPSPEPTIPPDQCLSPSAASSGNASGSDDAAETAQPSKRGRKSNRKVKTGCSNCKKRRIKCDEKRPACSQCVKSNKSCFGYPPPSRLAVAAIDIRIAPKPPSPNDSTNQQVKLTTPAIGALPPGATGLLLRGHTVVLPPRRAPRRRRQLNPHSGTPTMYQPSHALAIQHTEGLYFELFRVQTASELSGYFNSSFWTQRVLQECHYQPAIRHAVIALGALYKTLEQSCEPDYIPMPGEMSRMDSVMCHWQVAIRQYSEACHNILCLGDGASGNNKTRLMASVLLTCFDSFIGDHKQAIRQIQNGLGLLDRIQADQAASPSSPTPQQHVEEDLLVIFTRLAIQAKSYDMAFHFPHPFIIRLGPEGRRDPSSPVSTRHSPSPGPSHIPQYFQSLRDARLSSDKLCETLLRCIEHLSFAKAEPTYTLPTAWLQYVGTFQSQLDAWSRAFQHILSSRTRPGISPMEKRGIAALKMFQINTNILFSMMFFDREEQFDDYLPQFREIVALGREIIGDEEKRATAARARPYPYSNQQQHDSAENTAGRYSAHHVRPSFSADLGIVPPLFVVATKCRDAMARRHAIHLLRSSARREGMWDSEMSAKIGEWIMQLEERDEGMPGPDQVNWIGPPRQIPEHRRVMIQAVDFDLKERFAEMRVGTRSIHQGSEDLRKRVTRITW